MMTLKDCTKAELLWIIDRLRNRGLYRLDTIIAIALNDLEYQREQKKLDEADRLNEESARLRQQAAELLTPYEGKPILDIPADVLDHASAILEDLHANNVRNCFEAIGILSHPMKNVPDLSTSSYHLASLVKAISLNLH